MGVVERVRAGLHAMTAPPQQKMTGGAAAWGNLFVRGIDAWFGLTGRLATPYAQHPTVYAAVSAIAQGISALPLEMFPDGPRKPEKPLKNSIVADLLANPGPDIDGPQLLEETIDFMELYGDAFWLLDGLAQRDAKGP